MNNPNFYKTKLFNKHTIPLFIAALLLNGIYLYYNRKNLFGEGLIKQHGEIAYNLYQYNSIKINRARAAKLFTLETQKKRRVDYYEIDHRKYGPPTEYRNHYDTIGYGVLIGLLWKFTNSLNYFDIQLLQLLLFCFLLLFFYQIAFILFNKKTAFFSCIALLLFFPAIFLNVQVARDIWPFYSAIILTYVIVKHLLHKSSWVTPASGMIPPAVGGSFVALFQFMKPHSFALILATTTVLIIYSFFTKNFRSTFSLIGILLITNFIFFWLPFMAYNKIAYNRYIVSASGIATLHGLGEFSDNPWGYKLDDRWYTEFMKKQYPELTPIEHEDKAKELVWQAIKENPGYYLKTIVRRIPRFILPGLPSFNYQDNAEIYHMFIQGKSIRELISLVSRSPLILFDFITRHIYIGLYLLLAYLGMLLMLIRKKFFAFFLITFGILAVGYSLLFIHPDHRYIIPYYAFYALFVGYLFGEINHTRKLKFDAAHEALRKTHLDVE